MMSTSAPSIDMAYLERILLELLDIPSPTGWTQAAVDYVGRQLKSLGWDYELLRRGALRAHLPGLRSGPQRALAAHVDTLGAMIAELKPNGRCRLSPLGHWSARFAEGARVTILGEGDPLRGSVLPLKASGHAWGGAVDEQPCGWDQVELRIDAQGESPKALEALGLHVGAVLAFDPQPECLDTGYIVARHLDDKAGVAILLAALEALSRHRLRPSVDTILLITVTEEVGTGMGGLLPPEVIELLCVDVAIVAPGQASSERHVTVVYKDAMGPFDLALSAKLVELCRRQGLRWRRDTFRYYKSDAAAAMAAGHDLRMALIGFGTDASHGYERCHREGLLETSRAVLAYLMNDEV